MGVSITYKSWRKLTENFFEPEELLSPHGMILFNKGILVLQPEFVLKVVAFRKHLDSPFTFNYGNERLRGWRSGAENQDGKRNNNPFHPMGVAGDLSVKGLTSFAVAELAKSFGFRGVGLYDTFVHIDNRPSLDEDVLYFWDNRKNK